MTVNTICTYTYAYVLYFYIICKYIYTVNNIVRTIDKNNLLNDSKPNYSFI